VTRTTNKRCALCGGPPHHGAGGYDCPTPGLEGVERIVSTPDGPGKNAVKLEEKVRSESASRPLPNSEKMILDELRQLGEFARLGQTWRMVITVRPGVPPEKAVHVEFEAETRRLK